MNKIKIAWSLRIFLALVFCFSAYSKLVAPGLIEIILVEQGFSATREAVAIHVRLLIGLELALGLLFLQPNFLKRIVVQASLLFLVGFTAYLTYTGFVLGDKDNCGCFGEMLKLSPVESIVKNIILMIPVVVLFVLHKTEKKIIWIPAAVTVSAIGFVFVVSPINSAKDFKFGSYTTFIGAGRVDLSSGNKLLAVFNTECDHCQAAAKSLAELRSNRNFPEMYILFFTEGNVSVDSFKTLTRSDFPYRMIQVREFFNLIGQSPPRIYWLQNGKIKEKWDNNFESNVKKAFSIQ
ncbi:MAG: MauE/DoxX family redox-associated membrane protein [Melioribacteraceae bacterium]